MSRRVLARRLTAMVDAAAGDVAILGVTVRAPDEPDPLELLAGGIRAAEQAMLRRYQQAAWRERVYAITRGACSKAPESVSSGQPTAGDIAL